MVHQQKVSIIIPFYNEEKLLERAITSAVQQTYDLIEIILVNDGSTDTSLEIAQAHYKLDPRVKMFSSVNLGLGNARNIGLEKATGDFILFLDSDDALSAMAVEVLLEIVNNQQSDIGICMFAMHDKQGRPFKNAGWRLDNTAISGTDAIKEMYSGGIASVVWAKIYRSTLVNKIKFPVGVWFEDRPFLMKSFLLTNKISFTDKILYSIYSREDSITRRVVTKKRIIDLSLIYETEITILKENKALPELYQTIIHHHIIVLLDTFFLLAIDRDKIDNFEECKHIFWLYMEKFDRHRRQYAHTLNLKMKIVLGLLRGVKLLPWSWAEAIFKIVFRKKYKGIQLLKNS